MKQEPQKTEEDIIEEFEAIFWEEIGTETDPNGKPNMYLIRNEYGDVENGIDFSPELAVIKKRLKKAIHSYTAQREQAVREESYDLLDDMWGLICNVSGGFPENESKEWHDAFIRIRDKYLSSLTPNDTDRD